MGIPLPLKNTIFSPHHDPTQPFTGALEYFRCWLFIQKLRMIQQLERLYVFIRIQHYTDIHHLHRATCDRLAEFDTLSYCMDLLYIPYVCNPGCNGSFLIQIMKKAPWQFSYRICTRCLRTCVPHPLSPDTLARYPSYTHCFPTDMPNRVPTGANGTTIIGDAFLYYGALCPGFYFRKVLHRFPEEFRFCPYTHLTDQSSLYSWATQTHYLQGVWRLSNNWSKMTSFLTDAFYLLNKWGASRFSPWITSMLANPALYPSIVSLRAERSRVITEISDSDDA